MSIEPNSNHVDKDKITKKEEEKEELKDIPGYEDDDDYETSIDNNKSSVSVTSKEQFRVKMIKLFLIVVVAVVVIILIGYLVTGSSKSNYSYSDLEDEMVEATKSYFNDNKSKLPSKNQSVYITNETLANNGYMKPIDKYMKNETCTGRVVVKNISNSYDYTAYLDCGDSYKTRELYKEIVNKDKIVTSGYGLYNINGEYVYRGQYVNNYVKFKEKDTVWRILKVVNSSEVVLVSDTITNSSYSWDDRYNSSMENQTGINVYKNSAISTHLDRLYDGKFASSEEEDYAEYSNEEVYFNKNIKSKLKKYNACVGTRSEEDTSKDGSTECQTKYETKMSLLSVYDYLNASIDPGCTKSISPECQNYNYLSEEDSFWLANGVSTDSSKVYYVSAGSIDVDNAYSNNYIRTVIHLNDNVMIESGKGTKSNPYIIR